MGSKIASLTLTYLACLALATLVGLGSTDGEQDRKECTEKLVSLATCLNYVGGKAKSPPPDCCAGLKTVVEKSPRCLCILIKDRNDPNLAIKVNVTLALNLPSACNVPLNLTTCVDLLHLAPNSTDAKVFSDFEKSLDQKKSNTTASSTIGTSSPGSTAAKPNDAGKGKRWERIEIVLAATLLVNWFFTSLLHI